MPPRKGPEDAEPPANRDREERGGEREGRKKELIYVLKKKLVTVTVAGTKNRKGETETDTSA
jgi:hypothetical protein